MDKDVILSSLTIEELVEKLTTRILQKLATGQKNNQTEYVTTNQVADILHISALTVYKMRKRGKLPFIKINGKILYKREDVMKMLTSGN